MVEIGLQSLRYEGFVFFTDASQALISNDINLFSNCYRTPVTSASIGKPLWA